MSSMCRCSPARTAACRPGSARRGHHPPGRPQGQAHHPGDLPRRLRRDRRRRHPLRLMDPYLVVALRIPCDSDTLWPRRATALVSPQSHPQHTELAATLGSPDRHRRQRKPRSQLRPSKPRPVQAAPSEPLRRILPISISLPLGSCRDQAQRL